MTVPIGNPNMPDGIALIDTFPTNTLVYASTSGSTTQRYIGRLDPGQQPPPPQTWGASGVFWAGHPSGCVEGVDLLTRGYTAASGWIEGMRVPDRWGCGTRTNAGGGENREGALLVRGVLRAARQLHLGGLGGSPSVCPGGWCWLFSGDYTATVSRAQAEPMLQVTYSAGALAPNGELNPGGMATYAIASTPDSAYGVRIPRIGRSWRFVPDSGAPSVQTGGETFIIRPWRSGTLTVEGDANGYVRTFTVPITVAPYGMRVTADREIVSVGDTVRYTVTERGGRSFSRMTWRWRPVSSEGATIQPCASPCQFNHMPQTSGYMIVQGFSVGGPSLTDSLLIRVAPARLTLEADYEEAAPGTRVVFSGRLLKADGTAYSGSYTVESWTWTPTTDQPPVMSRAPTVDATLGGSQTTSSADSGDVIDRVTLIAESSPTFSPPLPQTQACSPVDLSCSTVVNESGVMSLVVLVSNIKLEAKASVNAAFFCPSVWSGRTEPRRLIVTSERGVLKWNRGYLEPVTVVEPLELIGPFTAMPKGTEVRRGGVLTRPYYPSDILRSPMDMLPGTADYIYSPGESSVRMQCWVHREKRKGGASVLAGYLQYDFDFQVTIVRPPLPPPVFP